MTVPGRRGLLAGLLGFSVAYLIALPLFAGGQAIAKNAALSTASPAATRVGLSILQKGGSAADAAVAVAFALATVHPHSGNLGGGGFLIYYEAATRSVWTLDFREVAPRTATRDMFAKLPESARGGALSAGVPGSVAGLDALHRKFGLQPWKDLLAPAIHLAREGFTVESDFADALERAREERGLEFLSDAERGGTIANADLANTLQRLAAAGARDFYDGELAKKLVAGVQKSGGLIGYRDLREYEPVWRAPIRLRFGDHDIYTVPPPAGGGIAIGAALNILSGEDLRSLGFQSAASLHLLIEAQRRAFIDHNRYAADPLAARIPFRDILSAERGEQWRKSINRERVIATASLTAPVTTPAPSEHTTHFTIADGKGNIVALTTSLGADFGSGVIVPGLGFPLNSANSDFTSGANAIDPGKRAASPLAPVLILHDEKPFLAIGTAGGASIAGTILQVFLNAAIYGKSPAEAVAAPRYYHVAVPDELVYEADAAPRELIDTLNAMGHGVAARQSIGDVHAIFFEAGRMIAVADPRHHGAAGGF